MKITIDDEKFGYKSHNCDVWVDGQRVECIDHDDKRKIIIKSDQEEIRIKIVLTNDMYSIKFSGILVFITWLVEFFLEIGESHTFGKPFDAVLEMVCKNSENIYIRTNSIWKTTPFDFDAGESRIITNKFYSVKGYKRRWALGIGFSIAIFIFLMSLTFINTGGFLIILTIAEACWLLYVFMVLTR